VALAHARLGRLRWWLVLLALTGLLYASCCVPAPGPIAISTPTPVGSWETVVEGTVYDRLAEPGRPVVGASVTYTVLHSYFPELQEGRLNTAITDERGRYALPVIVHDTDSIRILVEALGYVSQEVRLVGVDLVGGRNFDIRLARH
jgi:hypothetical protein